MRLARRLLACLLALALAMPTGMLAFADENNLTGGGDSQAVSAQALGGSESEIKIAVLSDMHYYPVNFVSDCADYTTYVGGDPKMLEESGSIADAALEMVRQDNPDILMVSGDLTKDGEIQGHRDLAAKFQKLEDETDIEVFVINGNHDLYNYTDACTFENGHKERAETTEQDDFKSIYANFGYNGEYSAQYFENPNAAQGEIAGQMSYTVDLGAFRIVAIDSCCYSPDGSNGLDTNEHITAGRIDEDLMPWVVEQIKAAEAEGDTVVGLMHHGVVPHFEGEEDLLYEYVVDDWQNVATQLADAGMRYVFTGHMHANDIAEYTTPTGNTIRDLETGSLSSWGSPVRSVTLNKGEPLDDGTARTQETFTVSTESVQSISFKQHTGETAQIDDFKQYTMDKLYSPLLFNNMANGMLRPMVEEIGDAGVVNYLKENFPELDIDTLVLDMVRDFLSTPMSIELGTGIGRATIRYANNGIQIEPSGTAGLIGDATITDAQILSLVYDVIGQVEARYIDDPDQLLGAVDALVTKVSNFGIESLSSSEHTLYDFVVLILTGHYAGAENPPSWVENAQSYIQSGEIVTNLIDMLLDNLIDDPDSIVNDLLNNIYIDIDLVLDGLLATALNSATDDGKLATIVSTFDLDIRELVEGLIAEYMSPSFLTGMGGLIWDIASSMLYDTNGQDDVENGEGRTIVFDGMLKPQTPTAENGLLPTQLTMTLGSNPQTDRQLRWFTGTTVTGGKVRMSENANMSGYTEYDVTSEKVVKPDPQVNLGLVTTYGTQDSMKHSATISGLELGKTYYYQVGDFENGWVTDPIAFTTGSAAEDSFTFINVNDSQGMIKSDYDTYLGALGAADATFSNASFAIHGGDFVDDGANEEYWTWALDDPADVSESLAYVPVAGNHEARSEVEGITDANPIVSHFNLANVPDQDNSTGTYYSFTYKNALFIVLNTNDLEGNQLSAAQIQWAARTASESDAQWKIIAMHKSPYSNGPHAQDDDVIAIRSQIDALCASCDIDLVLSGHDHVYNRTPYLMNGEDVNATENTTTYQGQNYSTAHNPNGTVFVIAGTAGVKNYEQDTAAGVPSKVNLDLDVPVYTGITIDGDALYYRAYTYGGGASALVDSFAISKAEDEETPAWQNVVNMIDALPAINEITTDDAAAIQAARDAYDALDGAGKEQVSNLAKLENAEKMLASLQSVVGKRTAYVSNHDDFTDAANDPNVGTIITSGTIEFDEGGLFDDGDREIYVTRDLIVGGDGTLRYCRFHVQNGATLILEDSVYVNDTRTQGSMYDALNPVEIEANSTLITRDEVSLRTEYGQGGSDEGVAVKLKGNGATAILGSSGSYWGSEAAIYSTVSNSNIVIENGVYNLKNNDHSAVDSPGTVEVRDGEIESLWCGGALTITGGEFAHQDSASNTRKPVQFDGSNMYVTGGTFTSYDGAAIQLGDSSNAHIMADIQGAVAIDGKAPYVSGIQTTNYKDVTASYNQISGTGNNDGIYRLNTTVESAALEQLADSAATRLGGGSVAGGTMSGQVPEGTSSVFGKYQLSGNGKSLSGITGGASVYAYGPMRNIENVAVSQAVITGDETRVVELADGSFQLTGYTLPANAFDNAVEWSVDDDRVLSLSSSFTLAQATPSQAGYAKVTMTATSNQSATDSVEVFVVDPEITGPDSVKAGAEEADRTFAANSGFSGNGSDRVSFKWSVDDADIATIGRETGVLEPAKRGTVEVTAELFVDGQPTGILVTKQAQCDFAPVIEETEKSEIANKAIDVVVSDDNELMTETHQPLTFDELIEDSYTFGDPYETEIATNNPIEALGRMVGLAKAPTQWRVDVTVKGQPYVDKFEQQLEDDGGTSYGKHVLQGEPSQAVTLLFDDEQGWVPETDDDAVITFVVACTMQAITVTPMKDANSFTYDGLPHVFAYTVDPAEIDDLKVEYSVADADEWSENAPIDAGTYDVRVTRDEDDTYSKVEATFEKALVISKAASTTGDLEIVVTPNEDGTVTVTVEGDGSAEWAADKDFTDMQPVDEGGVSIDKPGDYYLRPAGDDNHEPGDSEKLTIVKVAFNAGEGTVGETGENSAEKLIQQGTSFGDSLPTAALEGYIFGGWYTDEDCSEGKEFAADDAVSDGMTVYAKWTEENVAPKAPDAEDLLEPDGALYEAGFSVTLKDINQIHGGESGDHQPRTYGTDSASDAELPASALTVGTVQGSEGSWSVEVKVSGSDLLGLYATDADYGTHYFSKSDETGEIAMQLAWDEAEGAWKLADGQESERSFDVTCLTLRPAEMTIYPGGETGDASHFPDAYVVDGLGGLYTIGELNELLDEGTQASIKYYAEDGTEIFDDATPGIYTARIVAEGASAAGRADEATVNVNVGSNDYAFALEESDLTIRNISDASDAEAGVLDVNLVAADADQNAIVSALEVATGSVVAQLPADTTILVNGRAGGELEDTSSVRLLSDELLGAEESGGLDRYQALFDKATQAGYTIDKDACDFRYLDLVDASQSNAWVSSSDGTTVYWKVPKGGDVNSVEVLHFKGLHREYDLDSQELTDQIAASTVEKMTLGRNTEAGYVSFFIPESGFSPFVMTWEAKDPEPQMFEVSFDAGDGYIVGEFDNPADIVAGGTVSQLPVAERAGYTFDGWFTEDDREFTATTPVNSSMTVYAEWTANTYEVTLDANGGTFNGAPNETVDVTYDQAVGQLDEPAYEGYIFEGWFTAANGGTEVTADAVYQTAGPSTYYAHWSPDPAAASVTLTLNADQGMFEGDTNTATVQIAKGQPVDENLIPLPARAGYALAGWYLDEGFTEPVVFSEYADPMQGVEATVFNEDDQLYAKWIEDISEEDDISFTRIKQDYTGSPVVAAPVYGEGFPEAEKGNVTVFCRESGEGDEAWSEDAPVNAGTYDVRFAYEGSADYAPFDKHYDGSIVINPAALTQTGLVADPAEVEAGTALSDVKLAGGTVTMAGGTSVAGTWSWEDVDATVSQTGDYAAVFTPTKGAGNYQSLEVNVTITVNASGGEGPDPGVDPDPDPGTGGNPGGGPGADPEPEPEGSVQVPESEGGQTTVANPEARPGEAVSVSAAPADGWLVDRITVTDAEGNTVHVHYVGTGFYEFEMPEGGATVDVDYRKVTGALSFDDVAEGDWFFEVVGKVSGHGFMVGIGGTPLFDPNGSLDRAMMAQVIYNVAGRPSVDAAARLAFDDTPADAWYAEAVLWCAEEGVVGGYGGTNLYGAGDPVTREQLATMLWRLSGEPAAQEGALAAFPDAAAASDYAVSALCWAVEQGILRGDGGDGALRPADTATRAEVATMVMRWWEDVALA